MEWPEARQPVTWLAALETKTTDTREAMACLEVGTIMEAHGAPVTRALPAPARRHRPADMKAPVLVPRVVGSRTLQAPRWSFISYSGYSKALSLSRYPLRMAFDSADNTLLNPYSILLI